MLGDAGVFTVSYRTATVLFERIVFLFFLMHVPAYFLMHANVTSPKIKFLTTANNCPCRALVVRA